MKGRLGFVLLAVLELVISVSAGGCRLPHLIAGYAYEDGRLLKNATVTIAGLNSSYNQTTTASMSVSGFYTIRLTADDACSQGYIGGELLYYYVNGLQANASEGCPTQFESAGISITCNLQVHATTTTIPTTSTITEEKDCRTMAEEADERIQRLLEERSEHIITGDIAYNPCSNRIEENADDRRVTLENTLIIRNVFSSGDKTSTWKEDIDDKTIVYYQMICADGRTTHMRNDPTITERFYYCKTS
ncbi:MAG: hypothetical protein V1921_06745 [Candidatus Altiarchaeota archaeon]